MCTLVFFNDVCGAIVEKMIADGMEDDIGTVLSDLERRVSVTDCDTEPQDEFGI